MGRRRRDHDGERVIGCARRVARGHGAASGIGRAAHEGPFRRGPAKRRSRRARRRTRRGQVRVSVALPHAGGTPRRGARPKCSDAGLSRSGWPRRRWSGSGRVRFLFSSMCGQQRASRRSTCSRPQALDDWRWGQPSTSWACPRRANLRADHAQGRNTSRTSQPLRR